MTDSFPLKKILYSLYLLICAGLLLLLIMGGRQYQLYRAQEKVAEQAEKLLFHFSVVHEHIFTVLIDGEKLPFTGLSEEMETLNYNLKNLLDSSQIGEEFKLSLASSVDMPGLILLLRRIEAGEAGKDEQRRLRRELRTLGERLMLFDRVVVSSSRQRLIGFQNIFIGASCLAVSLLVGMLGIFHRRLLHPLWKLVDEADLLLAGERSEVSLSYKCKEASVLGEIINEQESLKEVLLARLHKCRQVGGDMVDSLGGIWAEIDENGLICQVNPEIEKVCGLEENELQGRMWNEFFQAPEGVDDIRQMVKMGAQELILNGAQPALQRMIRCVFVVNECGDNGCLFRCLGYDITADKKVIRNLEDHLVYEKQRMTGLARISQLTAIGELAYGVAHEVNDISNGIINYAQLLSDEIGKDGPDIGLLHSIISAGDKVASLAKNLMAYGKDDPKAREMVYLSEVIQNSISLMKPLFKQDGILVKTDFSELPQLHCPAGQMRQLFLALLNNSRQSLNLRYPGKDENKRLSMSGRRVDIDGNEGLEVIIDDFGIGFDPLITDQLFEAGYSQWPGVVGAGMGLFISREIIASLAGELILDSTDARTRITVRLPLQGNKMKVIQ